MKKRLTLSLFIGIIIGATLFGGSLAIAATVQATTASFEVSVDGVKIEAEAYVIDGHTFLQLKDIAKALDIGAWWDGTNRIARIETDKKYNPDYRPSQFRLDYPNVPDYGEINNCSTTYIQGKYAYFYDNTNAYLDGENKYIEALLQANFYKYSEFVSGNTTVYGYSNKIVNIIFFSTKDSFIVEISEIDGAPPPPFSQPETYNYYPNTQYRTFTDVTGTPLKEVIKSDITIYCYDYISTKDSSNAYDYISYLSSIGFSIYNTDYDDVNLTISVYLMKGNELFGVLMYYQTMEVFIISPAT